MSVTDVLMQRDGLTRDEAKLEIENFREDIEDSIMNGDLEDIEDSLMNDLGLEPDYLFDILM